MVGGQYGGREGPAGQKNCAGIGRQGWPDTGPAVTVHPFAKAFHVRADQLQGKSRNPPGRPHFIKRVELNGDFGIDAGRFSKPGTQQGVNNLSAGASGKKDEDRRKSGEDEDNAETVLSELQGHVLLKEGTARFSNLSFAVPGAVAHLQGTYDLITERVDFRGTLKTNEEISKTTHGFKTVMLKILDPFFKKKPAGYEAPVKITGTYEHPLFGLDLSDRDNKG
jgi:hypothetical protein